MRVFQIQKGEILIINGDKQYSDTVENFKLDSGLIQVATPMLGSSLTGN